MSYKICYKFVYKSINKGIRTYYVPLDMYKKSVHSLLSPEK